jgi:hypothetical protein
VIRALHNKADEDSQAVAELMSTSSAQGRDTSKSGGN